MVFDFAVIFDFFFMCKIVAFIISHIYWIHSFNLGSGSRGRGSRGRGNNRGTREKFTEDFNFEESNAKFNKEEIEKELLKVLNKVKISDVSIQYLMDLNWIKLVNDLQFDTYHIWFKIFCTGGGRRENWRKRKEWQRSFTFPRQVLWPLKIIFW